VIQCLQRQRDSMRAVLDLDELPEVEPDDDEEKHMRIQEIVSCRNVHCYACFHVHRLQKGWLKISTCAIYSAFAPMSKPTCAIYPKTT